MPNRRIISDSDDWRPKVLNRFGINYNAIRSTASTAFVVGYLWGYFDSNLHITKIERLSHLELNTAIDVILEPDGNGFIARTPDLPLYGYGEDIVDAIDMLKEEIESLYDDLMEDDNFSKDWLRIKKFLKERIKEDR